MTDYETERAQLDAEYKAAHAAALAGVSAVVAEFNRRKIALMHKHGVKNAVVELLEQGHEISHTGYPDGSSWYEVDNTSCDYDSDDGGAMARAITEAIDLGLIVEDTTRVDVYTDYYRLPQTEEATE